MTSLSLFSSFIDKKQISFIRNREKLFSSLSRQDKEEIFQYACYHGNLEIVQFFYNRTLFQSKNNGFKTLFISVLEKTTNPDVRILTWLYEQIQKPVLWDNTLLFYLARNLDNRIFILDWIIEKYMLSRSQYNKLLFSLAILKQPHSMLKILQFNFFQTRWDFLACCIWRLHFNSKDIDYLQYVIKEISEQWPHCLLHLKKVLCSNSQHKDSVRAGVPKMYLLDFQNLTMQKDFQFIFKQIETSLLYDKLMCFVDDTHEDDNLPHKV
jgi:hypothetical protein